MAPKSAKQAEPAAPGFPAEDEFGVPLPFKEEEAASLSLAAGAPFEDPKGTQLPFELAAAVASWKRPSEFLADLLEPEGEGEAAVPYVVGESAAKGEHGIAGSRAQPHSVVSGVPPGEGAAASVAWLTSLIHLVAQHSEKLAAGTYLWELIYPKGADGRPAVAPTGRYAVRLFEQSSWRLVEIDDRVPFDADGRPLVPVSTERLELWPMLLAKALYKLAAGAPPPGGDRDEAALLRLTGWMPERVPILPSLPKEAPCKLLSAMLQRAEAAIVCVSLPARGDAAAESLLAERGLSRAAMLAVCDVKEVDGARFVRLRSELMAWRGPYCDMDEMSWSSALSQVKSRPTDWTVTLLKL